MKVGGPESGRQKDISGPMHARTIRGRLWGRYFPGISSSQVRWVVATTTWVPPPPPPPPRRLLED